MKEIILILVTLFGLLIHTQGQTTAISIKGGVNSTWLLNKNLNDDIKISFGHTEGINFIWYGLPLNYYSDRMYGLGIDFMYATHTQNYEGKFPISKQSGDSFVDYSRSIKLTYVDIPLYFRLAHDQGGSYLEIGPQYSILLSANETFSTAENILPGYSEDIKEQIPANAWAVMLGFGFDFPVSSSLFIAGGVRSTYGFTDITQKMKEPGIDYKQTKRATGGAHVSLMYRLNSYHSSKAKVRKR
jgi:hypothetical protein